ncbi:thiamine diphosphokinase [Paracoccus zhejiangensis]|uniref:Thiamine diphosphokinase n=1 Tax=Paracoccus zhejiangensis TaxID=1077935 RepID=A0A2H5EUV4_9RHOB|nr:thiamine diphosphokinase [Paracoccus zhejiangensis]AUH63078.1 thiamine diphosphokinase [Paracoccus zhejiangensis]
MTAPVVTSAGGVTLIGGGAVSERDLEQALALAPLLVAADSGADEALELGHRPSAVIGDFDSLSEAARDLLPPGALYRVAEQDSTDFEKCLTRIEAPFVIAVGFAGRRLDHTLAALNVMARLPAPNVLLIAAEDVVFLCPPALSLDLPIGSRLSLFPMGPSQGTSHGLEWPIDGLDFAPAGASGTSNRVTGPVRLTMTGPMLVMLPRAGLAAALAGLGFTA